MEYFRSNMAMGLYQRRTTLTDRIIVDEKQKLIYIFGLYRGQNIGVMKIRDNNEFELLDDEILPPEDIGYSLCNSTNYMIYAFDSVVIIFHQSITSSDIWCCDLRNKKWFKSKYKMPCMEEYNVVNGEDNFVYFILYGSDTVAFNFKISLFDIIPSEMYEINKEKNRMLINGFMNNITKDTDHICPDCLINVVSLYYPQFLYV